MVTQRDLREAFPPGEVVSCRVVRREPFGVFVEVEGELPGFIHRHDWSWSRRILDLREVVEEGAVLKAQVVDHDAAKLLLSRRRALPNPYEEFRREYKAGETVVGEVKLLAKNDAGVLVTIDGVDGFIPRSELPKRALDEDGFGLFAGDRLAAKILRFDETEVQLSIRRAQLAGNPPPPSGTALRSHPRLGPKLEGFFWDMQLRGIEEPRLSAVVRQHVHRALIVEDNRNVSRSLQMVLEHLGLACDAVDSIESASDRLSSRSYDLVLLDLNLPRGRGAELLRNVPERRPLVYVLSAAANEDWREVLGDYVSRVDAFFRKPVPIHEIIARLNQHFDGSAQPMSEPSGPPPARQSPSALSAEVPLLGGDRRVKMEETLAHLLRDAGADQAFVLGYRPGPQFHLVAGRFRELTRQVQQNLEVSPVGDIIREHAFRFEPNVESSPKVFRHLVEVQRLGSFAGVGLDYRDQAEYGLFLIGKEANQLSGVSEARLRMAALQIGSLLAEERFDQVITEKQSLLLTGFLADSLLHEIKNEIQALDDFSSIPVSLIQQHGDDLGQLSDEEVVRLKQSAVEIQGVARSLEDLVRLFRHIAARPHEETVVLNDTVLRLVKTLRPFAEDHEVEIESDLGQDIPDLYLNPKLLEQPLLNIMINGIEQMSLIGISQRRLSITTRYLPDDDCPVRITLADSGPGISRVHWEKIFELFFTTKEEGTGLGLYISRFFIQRLGGRLQLAESLRYSGSTFEIELPRQVLA